MPRLLPHFASAAVLVALALLATDYMQRAIGFPSFLLLIPVVIFVSATWGAVVGAATVAATAVGMVLLMAPRGTFVIAGSADRASLIAFLAVAAVCVWLASRQYRLRHVLKENEAAFRALFELAAVGSARVDPRTSRIELVNDQFCTITGYSRDELLSMTIRDLTHPDDRARDRDTVAALLAGRQERWTTEKRYVRKDGGTVWVLVNGTIVRGTEGGADHLIAHAADISARRRAEEDAREANRLKDEFLATLSHELRTPLNVVAGWTSVLARTADHSSTAVRRAMPVIQRNVEALTRITDDLLGVSDVLAGRVRLQQQPVNVNAIVGELIESLSLATQAKEIRIEASLRAEGAVEGDENRLRQVFWNLLSNAIKFTPPGGTIFVSAVAESDMVTVRVADTGIGIDPEFLPHVFDKFRQEDGSHTRAYTGLGLGLTVAHHFTELHGGRISAESGGRDGGATFTVTLPCRAAAATSSSPHAAAAAAGPRHLSRSPTRT